jgi:hypothetical protein
MDNLRKEWLTELEQIGILTDHDESMNDDYLHLTRPAFALLKWITKKYQNLLPNCQEEWYLNTIECLEEEGGSPRDMQLEMIKKLK